MTFCHNHANKVTKETCMGPVTNCNHGNRGVTHSLSSLWLINITVVSSLLIPSIKLLPFGCAVISNSDFHVFSLEHKLYHKHGNFIPMVTQVWLNHPLALNSLHKVDNEILPVRKCLQCVTLQVLSPLHIFVSGWHYLYICCSIQTSVLVQ